MNFENAYNNTVRAESYAKLDFPNTYYLAYRDLPKIIAEHTNGNKAIDFGCGTGRSTRFLKNLGFDALGIDISSSMIEKAREFDPNGKYQLVEDGDYLHLGENKFDLILSVFTFDNIPGAENRANILKELKKLIISIGKIILLDSTPDLYVNDCASFTTTIFPKNRKAQPGDVVKVLMNDVEDKRPVEDVLWTDADYREMFEKAGLNIEAVYKPLGKEEEPFNWKMETELAPWVIYVLQNR